MTAQCGLLQVIYLWGRSLTYTVSAGMYLYPSGLTCIPVDPCYFGIQYPGSIFSLPLSVMIDLTAQISNCLEDTHLPHRHNYPYHTAQVALIFVALFVHMPCHNQSGCLQGISTEL